MPQRSPLTLPLVAAAVLMEATYLCILAARTPAEQVLCILVSYAVAGVAFGWLLWLLRDVKRTSATDLVLIAASALAFRLTLWPLDAWSSQDIHRYLWEGLVNQAGHNPYLHTPNSETLTTLAAKHADLHARVTFGDVGAVYPPTTQLLFWLNATLFGASFVGWKLILLAFDGLMAGGIALVLRQRGLPLAWLAAVLWCPLLVIEPYEGGHSDIIGAALVVWAVAAGLRQWPVLAAVAVALAFNVKYMWPGLAGLLVLAELATWRRRLTFAALAAAIAVVMWLPYRAGVWAALDTAVMFASVWEFNSAVVLALRSLPGPRWTATALTCSAMLMLTLILALRRRRDLWRDTWLIMGTALLLSPVAYPWYFLWALPGIVIRPAPWIVWCVLSVGLFHWADFSDAAFGQWDRMHAEATVFALVTGALLAREWCRTLRGQTVRTADPTD